METERIKSQFNAVSEKYDSQRRELIPCFDDFYGIAVQISGESGNVKNILDLGAGTGLMSAFFFEKFPEAQFTLIDVSAEMLAKAEERFAGYQNFNFVEKDFSALNFNGESFELVVSSLAIHHLEDDAKRELFKKIYEMLKPGGMFINADQVLGEDDFAEKIYTTVWKNAVLENKNLSEEAKAATFERIKLDKMATLKNQLLWLKEAGFTGANNFYQYYNFVVFAAQKS